MLGGLGSALSVEVSQSTARPDGRKAGDEVQALRAVCREFEAILVEQVLRQARSAAHVGAVQKSFGRGVYESWQDQTTAGALAAGDGIGLAEMLSRQLARRVDAAAVAAPAADQPAGEHERHDKEVS